FRIVRLNPAGLECREVLIRTFCTILMLQPVLYNFILKCAYSTYNLTVVHFKGKQLRYTFVHQLVNTFFKLLGLHWVGIVDVTEMLRREARYAFKAHDLTFGKRIAYFKVSCIMKSYDITGIRN